MEKLLCPKCCPWRKDDKYNVWELVATGVIKCNNKRSLRFPPISQSAHLVPLKALLVGKANV